MVLSYTDYCISFCGSCFLFGFLSPFSCFPVLHWGWKLKREYGEKVDKNGPSAQFPLWSCLPHQSGQHGKAPVTSFWLGNNSQIIIESVIWKGAATITTHTHTRTCTHTLSRNQEIVMLALSPFFLLYLRKGWDFSHYWPNPTFPSQSVVRKEDHTGIISSNLHSFDENSTKPEWLQISTPCLLPSPNSHRHDIIKCDIPIIFICSFYKQTTTGFPAFSG